MLGILRQKVGAGSSSAMILGQRIRPATSAMRGFASSAKEVLLGDVGARKSSLVLRFVKEQFVEFQQNAGIHASDYRFWKHAEPRSFSHNSQQLLRLRPFRRRLSSSNSNNPN